MKRLSTVGKNKSNTVLPEIAAIILIQKRQFLKTESKKTSVLFNTIYVK